MVTIEAEYVQCERTQQNCRKKIKQRNKKTLLSTVRKTAVYICIKNTKMNELHYSRYSQDRSVLAICAKRLPVLSVLDLEALFAGRINSFRVSAKETLFLNASVLTITTFLFLNYS